MKKTLTVLLIEDSAEYATLVQQWLSLRTDISFVVKWADSLQAGLNRLEDGDVDVILLDLTLPDSSGLETFTSTRLKAPRVPIILLSGDKSEQLALQMVQDGAQDYIVKGSCNGDSLAKAIQYSVVRTNKSSADPSLDQATVVGVMGVNGGVGGTTIACNLAVELRRQTNKKTLLADLDLDGGMVSFVMGAESAHNVLDATAMVDRFCLSSWQGLVSSCIGDVDVLPSPSLPGIAEPDADNLERLLAKIRKLYSWVILDLGRPAKFSLSMLPKVTELFLVTTTSVPALYETKRAIESLRKTGFERDRLKVIVNQLASTQKVSGNELNRLFGLPVFANFPAASQELHDACVEKRLLGKNSDFRVQMSVLARKMGGLQPEQPRSRVSQIFSFSEKPSGVDTHASRNL